MIDFHAATEQGLSNLLAKGILTTDQDMVIRGWNQWLEIHSGQRAEEMIGQPLFEVYPDLHQRAGRYYEQALDGQVVLLSQRFHGHLLPLDPVIRHSAFSYMPQSARIVPLRQGEQIIGTLTIIEDVTERVLREVELQRQVASLEALYEIGLAILSLNLSECLQQVVEESARLVAAPLVAVVLRQDGMLRVVARAGRLAPDEPEASAQVGGAVEMAMRSGNLLWVPDLLSHPTLKALDARSRSLIVTPLVVGEAIIGALVVESSEPAAFDEEDRRQVRRLATQAAIAIANARLYDAMRVSEARSRILAETGRVLASSLDYQVTLDNLAAFLVTELADWCIIDVMEGEQVRRLAAAHREPEKAPLIRALQQRYPPAPRSPVLQVLHTGESMLLSTVPEGLIENSTWDSTHIEMIHALGARSLIIVPLLVGGRTLGTLTLISGTAEQYQAAELALAEEIARRAALALDNALLYRELEEAVRLRDIFFSIASHELKTPITTIKGYIDLLLRRAARDGTTSARDLQTYGIIQDESARLNRLIDLLLDLSRIQRGQLELTLEAVDLCDVAERLVEQLRSTSQQHTFRLDCPAETLLVEGDPLRLEQILQNLLQNAIKYSPNGGTITTQLEQQGEHAVLTITDEGIGIPVEARSQLFNSFYRAGNVSEAGTSGMGLGLYIVSRIVEAHRGTIQVTSELGMGSTFRVELPLSQSEEQASP